jgi:hypothetical protein
MVRWNEFAPVVTAAAAVTALVEQDVVAGVPFDPGGWAGTGNRIGPDGSTGHRGEAATDGDDQSEDFSLPIRFMVIFIPVCWTQPVAVYQSSRQPMPATRTKLVGNA